MSSPDQAAKPSLSRVVGERMRAVREERGWRQDEVAARARDFGLRWTRATVASVETGRREVTIGELLLLPDLLRYAVELPDLVPPGTYVMLGPDAFASSEGVRARFLGLAGQSLPAELDVPCFRKARVGAEEALEVLLSPEGRRAMQAYEAGMEAVWPKAQGGDLEEWMAAERDADQEVERRAAERLGVDARHLALAARRCWGHSLTEERDKRTPTGVLSRGHITRTLLAELRPVLAEAELLEDRND